MRRAAVGVAALLALAAPAWPGRARACSPRAHQWHEVDEAQVGVDRTPPDLPQPVAQVHANELDDGLGCGPKCGSDWYAELTNLATDDMTPFERIGYRVTTVVGSQQVGPQMAFLPWGDRLSVSWNGDGGYDFTLQVIAIDAAGNESAPRTVRIHDDSWGCSVGRRRARGGLTILAAVLALVTRRRSSRAALDRSRSRSPRPG
jgi:hypothetical protein